MSTCRCVGVTDVTCQNDKRVETRPTFFSWLDTSSHRSPRLVGSNARARLARRRSGRAVLWRRRRRVGDSPTCRRSETPTRADVSVCRRHRHVGETPTRRRARMIKGRARQDTVARIARAERRSCRPHPSRTRTARPFFLAARHVVTSVATARRLEPATNARAPRCVVATTTVTPTTLATPMWRQTGQRDAERQVGVPE